jgi:hypothetical protein
LECHPHQEFLPALAFAAAEFRFSLCEIRRQKFSFTFFDFWCSIKVVERKYNLIL